jgi:hypothetical protein
MAPVVALKKLPPEKALSVVLLVGSFLMFLRVFNAFAIMLLEKLVL